MYLLYVKNEARQLTEELFSFIFRKIIFQIMFKNKTESFLILLTSSEKDDGRLVYVEVYKKIQKIEQH